VFVVPSQVDVPCHERTFPDVPVRTGIRHITSQCRIRDGSCTYAQHCPEWGNTNGYACVRKVRGRNVEAQHFAVNAAFLYTDTVYTDTFQAARPPEASIPEIRGLSGRRRLRTPRCWRRGCARGRWTARERDGSRCLRPRLPATRQSDPCWGVGNCTSRSTRGPSSRRSNRYRTREGPCRQQLHRERRIL
jgi:hypothetical protein